MNKLALSILCILVGFVAGIITGNAIRGEREPQQAASRPSHYYYWLNDSTIVRHAISGSDSSMVHRVDTLLVETMYAGSDAKRGTP
jgi:hypothetical protein